MVRDVINVLVVGATGANAGLVVPALRARGARVRALVRDPGRADEALRRGAAETVPADLTVPESLPAAVDGMDGVFHIGPAFSPKETDMGVALVRAAERAGVRRFAFSSIMHPSVSAMPHHPAKLGVEEALCDSGLAFTILQPAMFMQNLRALWDQVIAGRQLALPYSSRAKMSWVDYRDVAEAAAMALTTDELSYGTFELAAPGMLDRHELAAVISEELGEPVTANQSSLDDWVAATPPGHVRDGLARMFAHYHEHGLPGGNALCLRAILGREPRSVRQYVRELARPR